MTTQGQATRAATNSPRTEVSDEEIRAVIADFLEMGHVENIMAMFRQEPRYYDWVGLLLTDERFAVRLGVSVLMEALTAEHNAQTALALPSLVPMLRHQNPLVRGEAASVLAIIGTPAALAHVRELQHDPSPQVREVVGDILEHGDAA